MSNQKMIIRENKHGGVRLEVDGNGTITWATRLGARLRIANHDDSIVRQFCDLLPPLEWEDV